MYLFCVFVYLCICLSMYLYLYICTCVFMMVLAGWRAAEEVGLILSPIFTHDRDGLCYLYQPIFTNLRLNRSSALYFLDALATTHSYSLWVAHSIKNMQVCTFLFLYFQFMFFVCGQLCAEVHIQQWAVLNDLPLKRNGGSKIFNIAGYRSLYSLPPLPTVHQCVNCNDWRSSIGIIWIYFVFVCESLG